MAEQEDAVGPARIFAVMECEVEAIPNVLWKLHLSRLEPWLQAELNEVTFSDGFQTYLPRLVWLLLCFYEASKSQKLN